MRMIDADALLDLIHDSTILTDGFVSTMTALIAGEPTIYPEWTDIVKCKDCKHFYLDKPYVIQGVPVLGHEVCDAWGDGCKTSQDGYCFLAERRTDECFC